MISTNTHDNNLDCYILSDQPTTCGKCGSRTSFEILEKNTQKHQCLNVDCGYQFLATEENE